MRADSVRRWAGASAMLLLCAAPAFAQQASGGGEHKSLLEIFREGIEVPTYFIVLGSLVVITLIIEHFLTVRRASISPVDQLKKSREQIESRSFRECLEGLRKSRTFFAQTMTAGLQHARHGFDAMHEASLEKSGQLSGKMFRKVEYLNIIGNLGPLLGLLGTVWGMIEAFGELGAGGGGGQLAGGISKALVNTLAGLALAILGIGFFGLCRNRIESLTVAATVETLDLMEYFRPSAAGSRSSERGASRGAATKAAAAKASKPATETPGEPS